MRRFSKFLAVVAGLAFAASLSFAAPQNIVGKLLSVKQKPGDASTRKITGVAKEKSSSDTLVGDPTISGGSIDGAFLDVFANAGPGGTSSSQRFTLPSGSWSKIDKQGFKYKDPKGTNGPVKGAIIKRTPSGVFLIKAKITAKNGTVNVFPPDPGDSGCVALQLGPSPSMGDRYSVQFNNTGDNVTNVDGKLFKVKKPTDDSTACPQITPTTTTSSTSAAPTSTSTTTSTTGVVITTTTSTTTTTTLYGSPSRAFLAASADLLD
jgi:hypothetical protein